MAISKNDIRYTNECVKCRNKTGESTAAWSMKTYGKVYCFICQPRKVTGDKNGKYKVVPNTDL